MYRPALLTILAIFGLNSQFTRSSLRQPDHLLAGRLAEGG